jgi:hypothetical protein
VAAVGFVLGFVLDFIIQKTYPKHKMTIWVEKTGGSEGRYWEAHADFLWYSNVVVVDWSHHSSTSFDKTPMVEHILQITSLEKEADKEKQIVYSPKAAQPSPSIAENIEHVKQVAAQNGIKLPDAFEKIEEIRRKTYQDEPPAKPMVNPPVVLKADEASVRYTQNGKTQTRSRRGFAKQYGEPVLSKIASEPTKKTAKKAKARTKA